MEDTKWIEIARAGSFTDSMGRPQTFSNADLADIAASFDPKKRDCALCIGHPQGDSAPAFGWAKAVKAEGQKLFAQFALAQGGIRELVANGHYRHVSMSLMPDRKTLRHVALLGAAQPAIDGLKAVEFENGPENITIEIAAQGRAAASQRGEANSAQFASPLECRTGMSDRKLSNEGGEMPENDLQREIGALKERIASLEKENASLKDAAKGHKETRDKAEADKKAAEDKAEKAAADFAAYRDKVETEKREARVSAMVEAGKITPAEKANVLQFAAALAARNETCDFAAPDGATLKLTLEEKYLRECEARPVSGMNLNFNAPPAHVQADKDEYINPSELTAKL